MGCIVVRKGIFITLLTTSWQSMQSCNDESHSINIYGRNHRWLVGGVSHLVIPTSYVPGDEHPEGKVKGARATTFC